MGNLVGLHIKKFIKNYNDFNNEISPFISTDEGKQILDKYRDVILKHFPWYFAELKGISDGSQVELNTVNIKTY